MPFRILNRNLFAGHDPSCAGTSGTCTYNNVGTGRKYNTRNGAKVDLAIAPAVKDNVLCDIIRYIILV